MVRDGRVGIVAVREILAAHQVEVMRPALLAVVAHVGRHVAHRVPHRRFSDTFGLEPWIVHASWKWHSPTASSRLTSLLRSMNSGLRRVLNTCFSPSTGT